MPYKPKYCCQCGGKIERIDRRFWHSRRFCELCETEFWIHDWFPRLTGIGILLVVFVTSFYFQKTEKPLNVAPNQFVSGISNGKSIPANQNTVPSAANIALVMAQTSANTLPAKSPITLKASEVKNNQVAGSSLEPAEKVYFCGAETKKGTPCSRRVRGGGRCWQHIGQAAMLAQEKLIAGQ